RNWCSCTLLLSLSFSLLLPPPASTLFPYTTLFRSGPLPYAMQMQRLYALSALHQYPAALERADRLAEQYPAAPDLTLLRADLLRSEEHTSELQSLRHLVCRLLLEKKKTNPTRHPAH